MGFGWTKSHYALVYAVIGAFLPYMPLYLHELGLADWQIGWVLAINGAAVMVMPVVAAHLADRRWSQRTVLGAGYALAAVGLAALMLTERFGAVLLACAVFYIGFTPLINLLDGLTFAAMHRRERAGGAAPPYHHIRIWGSIGFMLPGIVLFVALSRPDASNRTAIVTAAACALAAALTARRLPKIRPEHREEPMELPSVTAWRTVVRGPALSLEGPLLLLFTAIAIFYAFYTRYLQELGIGVRWAGLVVNLGVAAEIVLMLGSGPVLRRLGVRGVVMLGAASMVVRLGLLAAVPTAAVAIATQLLHAPIVMCLYVLPPIYLNLKAAPSHRNSIQGLHGVLCFGVARLVGSVAGGYAAEADLRWAMALAAALSAVAGLWFVAGFRDHAAQAAIRRAHGAAVVEAPLPEP